MQRKPLLAAVGAAESRPPVFGIPYRHQDTAVSTIKCMLDGLRLHVFGMFPVQPLAMGRAEFSPLIGPMGHDYNLAAAKAAEGTQHRAGLPLRRRRFVPVPVRIAPAYCAAVLLRHAVRRKHLAAHRACRFPFHSALDLPVHADVELIRVFVVIAEGLFHIQEHVRPLAELMREAETYVVPGTFVFIGRIEIPCRITGFNILIPEEFVER